jgi:diguanylate cyclase (GGDEF)-like protein/putative nucleotidyltransferase with HDIG domain
MTRSSALAVADDDAAADVADTFRTVEQRRASADEKVDQTSAFSAIDDWQVAVRAAGHESSRWLSREDYLAKFWLSYIRAGFLVPAAQGLAMAAYLLITPGGELRHQLLAGVAAVVAFSAVGLSLSVPLSHQPWRAKFSTFLAFVGCLCVAAFACADGGLDSPLLFWIVLPIMYAALALSPRSVALCSGAAMVGVVVAGFADGALDQTREIEATTYAVVAGVIVLALVSAIIRARLESAAAEMVGTLRQRAELDELTGCANARAFYELLNSECERAIRLELPLALLMVDVDLFEAFNETHGRVAGNAALAKIGGALMSTARLTDLVARVGGDEFALLMPGTTSLDAGVLAGRLVEAASVCNLPPVSVSIGIAELQPGGLGPAGLIRDADAALYDAKENGRNRAVASGSPPLAEREGARRGRRADVEHADRKLMTTAVRQARRETEEQRTILATLAEVAHIGLAFTDRDFRVGMVNPTLASINGLPVSEQLGRRLPDLLPALWPMIEPLYRRVLDEKTAVLDVEVRGPTAQDPDNDHDWLSSFYPVRVGDVVIGVGNVVIDITERKQLERTQIDLTDAVVRAMSATAEARDPYTAGHQRRVAEIAAAIATDLGLDEHAVHGVKLAATVHDIGKVSIPAEILARPGRLAAPEMDLVRRHAVAGFEILRDVEFPWPIAQMVVQHHERMDGSGYPYRLRGDEILMGARIVAVADTLEAMASHRPYRASLGLDEALFAVREGRAGIFDATVVDSCLRLFENGPLTADLLRLLKGEQADLPLPSAPTGPVQP